MSAVVRWRCDVCGTESDTTVRVENDRLMPIFSPSPPDEWKRVSDGRMRRELCSQPCVVAHYEGVVRREQRRLSEGSS